MSSETIQPDRAAPDPYDVFIVGGGVNGCGIARDAAGRGLRVGLAEMGDIGGATSSASTKLFHGGLRYLEYFEFKLVQHSLVERERLLRAMPHISWPMRFVLPYDPAMRFESSTPTSRLLSKIMPWMKGRRPAWLIRLGLLMYDNLGGRKLLPGTKTLRLSGTTEGRPLQDRFAKAFEYSDCWVEDSRLVALNARDAALRGATILPRTKVVSADREGDLWRVTLEGADGKRTVFARSLINAGGPWVEDIVRSKLRVNARNGVRLVRGSHIVTRKLYDHDKCYFFQGRDGRIIFAIPYEGDFTLIGTTDVEHPDPSTKAVATDEEQDYLCAFASDYFKQPVTRDDIVWTYSGVRPLYDDKALSAAAATRDYVLDLDETSPPALHVYGGKITTYRKLAEQALEKLGKAAPVPDKAWTAGVPLPGGDFGVREVDAKIERLAADYPFLDRKWARRLIRAYGTDSWEVLGSAKTAADLGEGFGASLTAAEVDWLCRTEFAQTADDILWRRSKLGLKIDAEGRAALERWLETHLAPAAAAE